MSEDKETQKFVTWLLSAPDQQAAARLAVGASLGTLKILRDIEGLSQAIDYCNAYLKELEDESARNSN